MNGRAPTLSPYRDEGQAPSTFVGPPRVGEALSSAYEGLFWLLPAAFFASPVAVILTQGALGSRGYFANGLALLGAILFFFVALLFLSPVIEHLGEAMSLVREGVVGRRVLCGVEIEPSELRLRWSDGSRRRLRRAEVASLRRAGHTLHLDVWQGGESPGAMRLSLPSLSRAEQARLDGELGRWMEG